MKGRQLQMNQNVYEAERDARIASNNQRLLELGIPQLVNELQAASTSQQRKDKKLAPPRSVQTVPRETLPRQAKETAQARIVQCRRQEETSPHKLLQQLKHLSQRTAHTTAMSLVPLDPKQSATTQWLAVFHSSEGLDGEPHQTAVAQALTDANLKPVNIQHLSADDCMLLLQRICRPALPVDDLFADLAFSRYKVVFQELRTNPEGGEKHWLTNRVPPSVLHTNFGTAFANIPSVLVQGFALDPLQQRRTQSPPGHSNEACSQVQQHLGRLLPSRAVLLCHN